MVTEATEEIRRAFSERLNEVLDRAKLPPKGAGRQKRLGDDWGVSQKGARKWLEGESIPETARLIEMAIRYRVSFEWLATGRDPRTLDQSESIIEGSVRPSMAWATESHSTLSPPARKLVDAVAEADRAGTPGKILTIVADLLRAFRNPAASVEDYPGLEQ